MCGEISSASTIWTPLIGESLLCKHEPDNIVDKNAEAIIQTDSMGKDRVVGHLPENISKTMYLFLKNTKHRNQSSSDWKEVESRWWPTDLKYQFMFLLAQLNFSNGSRENYKFVNLIWIIKLISAWNKKSILDVSDQFNIMSANWRAKIGVLAISYKKNRLLIRGTANWVSTF